VITITGSGDHDQPDWLITMTGIRSDGLSNVGSTVLLREAYRGRAPIFSKKTAPKRSAPP
jgi:hypothetical protein